MEFTSFTELVRKEISQRVGGAYEVKVVDVAKNNGVYLKGINIMTKESNISPTIYLNDLYDAFCNDEITMESVVECVISGYNRNKVSNTVDLRDFLKFEKIKDNIVFKLVNTDRNCGLLEDIPHIPYLDLSIVFQCIVKEEMFNSATILIHNAHMEAWGITVEELYEVAVKNTPKVHELEILNMNDVVKEMMEMQGFDEEMPETPIPMYILSNKTKLNGAASMLYRNVLKDFATALGHDMYILPSSVHEVILLPAFGDEDEEELRSMVRETNESHVEPEEVLSDSVYYYERETGEIRVA